MKQEAKPFTIGMLGGMGTYATIFAFKQYATIFDAKKEWERPRILIDNNCTMPSRVRAFLYQENVDDLVQQMHDSLVHLKKSGATDIFLACNTSHLFLEPIEKMDPELFQQVRIHHMIQITCKKIKERNLKSVFLLASEGTIESKIYQKELEKYGITCICPTSKDYPDLRTCIEAVKQNQYSKEVKDIFLSLMDHEAVILGCTELPVLYEKYQSECNAIVFDPVYETLLDMKKEWLNQ